MFRIAAICLFIASTVYAQQNIVFVLDGSGSMSTSLASDHSVSRMEMAKTALKTVLKTVPNTDNVGLVVFSASHNGWVYNLGPIDYAKLNSIIDSITPGWGTPLGEYTKLAGDALLSLQGVKKLVILTDGEANDVATLNQYVENFVKNNVSVDVIGLDMQQNHSLSQIASSYRRGDNLAGLENAIREILGEMSVNDTASQEAYETLKDFPTEAASGIINSLKKYNEKPPAPNTQSSGNYILPLMAFFVFGLMAIIAISNNKHSFR